MTAENKYVQIRCPRRRYFPQYSKIMVCNRLCAEVEPGSKGRAFCASCRSASAKGKDKTIDPYFRYEIDENYTFRDPVVNHIKAKPTT